MTAIARSVRKVAARAVKARVAPSEAKPIVRSEGSYRLARLGLTNRQIAEALDVEASTIGRWISGENRPTAKQRKTLLDVYGIALNAWDVPHVNGLAGGEEKAKSDEAAKTIGQIYREECWKTLEDIRTRRNEFQSTTPDERLKMLARCGELYERIVASLDEGEQLAALIRLQAWKRLKATMLEALRGYPDATATVVEAIRRAELGE